MSNPFLSAFNNQINEFMNDILLLFPNDIDIVNAKNSISLMKKMNPSIIIKSWYQYIYLPYNENILNEGIEFIINKDYTADIQAMDDSNKILDVIDRIKKPISKCSTENKDKCLQYIINLNKLSFAYSNKN